MRKKHATKLRLHRETIRTLNKEALSDMVGGIVSADSGCPVHTCIDCPGHVDTAACSFGDKYGCGP